MQVVTSRKKLAASSLAIPTQFKSNVLCFHRNTSTFWPSFPIPQSHIPWSCTARYVSQRHHPTLHAWVSWISDFGGSGQYPSNLYLARSINIILSHGVFG